MHLSGTITTLCPPEYFMSVMADPRTLKALLPPESTLTRADDGAYLFRVIKALGPIRLTMPGTMTLVPTDTAPDHRLTVQAAHMIGGKAEIVLLMTFSQDKGLTELTYSGDLKTSGLVDRLLQERQARLNGAFNAALRRLAATADGSYTGTSATA